MPGESFLPVLDALWEAGIGVINTRHEAAAANMAEAAGKLTGRAAVCLVTRGPGASHASIALHTAYQDGTPLVLVVGQVDRELLGRDAFQEMDYELVFGSSAKAVLTIDDADRIPELVAQAMQVAHGGRPGPVVLVVPEDVQYDRTAAPVTDRAARPPPRRSRRPTGTRCLARLCQARRPVLIVGGPGWSQSVGDDRHRLRRAQRDPDGGRLPLAGRGRQRVRELRRLPGPRRQPRSRASASPTTPT